MIGAGVMGAAIVRRLLSQKINVVVYNRTFSKAIELEPYGAVAERNIFNLINQAEIIFFCLGNEQAIEEIISKLLEEAAIKSKYFINISTVSANFSDILRDRVEKSGGIYLDAPVSGGPEGAISGSLTAICSGSNSGIKKCLSILKAFCSHVACVGDTSEAQTLKILNNLAESINLICAAEVISLAKQKGFHYDVIKSVLSFARGRSAYMDLLLDALISNQQEVAVSLAIRLKDMRLSLDIIRELSNESILADRVYKIFEETTSKFGAQADQTKCFEIVKLEQKTNLK